MQLPTRKTPVSKCIALGRYCQQMLAMLPGNAVLTGLGSALSTATSALEAAQSAYASATLALVIPRVKVKYADFSSDRAVRATLNAAAAADDESKKVSRAVFPDGVTPIVRPIGKTQCDEMRALEGRLAAAVAIWPGAAAEKAKVTTEREGYETALAARATAMQQVSDLRAQRDAAKEDFLDVYSVTAARIKGEFPRNPTFQDLFFDRVSEAVVAEDDAEDTDDSPPAATPPA